MVFILNPSELSKKLLFRIINTGRYTGCAFMKKCIVLCSIFMTKKINKPQVCFTCIDEKCVGYDYNLASKCLVRSLKLANI